MRRILTRTILVVSFVSLFTDIASEMLYPVIPLYLSSIGFSAFLIGLLEGLAEATAGISKGFFGNLSDKTGRRLPFVQWGYLLSAVSKPLMVIFSLPVWVFFTRSLDRFGKGIRTGARDAMLSDESTPETKGRVFGFHRAMDTLGAAIGPFAALIYLYYYPQNYKWLFVIAVIPGIIAISLTFLLKEKRAEKKIKPSKNILEYLNYWKRSVPQYRILIIGLLVFTLFNSSDAFLLLMVKNRGFSDAQLIGVYIFYNLIYALFAFPLGMLADRIGLKNMLILGLLVFIIVYAAIGFTFALWQIALIFGLYGIYSAATEGVSKALISNISGKNEVATAIGFYTSFASIFTMIASSLGGFIWVTFGPRSMFLTSAAGVSIAVLLLVFGVKINNISKD